MNSKTSNAALGAQQYLEAKAAAERILRIGVQRGIVSEYTQTTILPNWTVRYDNLSSAEQAALKQAGGIPTPLAYGAALKVAGATFAATEVSTAFMTDATNVLGGHVQENTKANGLPRLVDTPEHRAEALTQFGIDI